MGRITTQSLVANDKKNSVIHGVVAEGIAHESKKIRNAIQKFKNFCERQQENRIGWLAFTVAAEVYMVLPITLIAIFFNGNGFGFWIPVIVTSFAVEVSNLATMPTKITIPIFCASILINVVVIILSFMI